MLIDIRWLIWYQHFVFLVVYGLNQNRNDLMKTNAFTDKTVR